MRNFRNTLVAVMGVLTLVAAPGVKAQETLKLGLSTPMSGAAASWGLGMEWGTKQAAQFVNDAGGVKVGGKSYKFEIVSYDNKYTAAEGTKVAQTLLNRDGVRYIAGTIGTAPTMALQSLSERKGALLFTTAWGASIKGPKFPLTFTQFNTPNEVIPPFYSFIKKQHPSIKTVAILNPNDATGKETEMVARKIWESQGVKVVSSDWYERGTTEFQPIAAKMVDQKPDVIDLGVAPPSDGGILFKEIKVLGWSGVKVLPTGTSAEAMMKIGGDAVEGVYLGIAADFDGPQATEIQRKLSKGLRAAIGEQMNPVHVSGYDAIMALKAGMEAANSLDPKAIAAVLPKIVFESSYGKTAFGGKATYGSVQHMLLPIIVTQVKNGKLVELDRVIPEELTKRLAAAKK
ncbi:MAG: ABC transporter substrate-binding protein [Burkholderiaceae bacterium]|nr:ABC transporter substrate-binding protein [Burkholderiaceae bacterium]